MRPFLLLSVVALLYSHSLGHNFLFDEENIILNNKSVQDLSQLGQIFKHGYFPYEEKSDIVWNVYYRPLVSLSFALDYRFWKTNPLGYNLVNMLLHALVTALLFFFLRVLLKNERAAFWAVLAFAAHPLCTEAVTYIASRGDLAAAIFILGSMLAYLKRRRRLALACYVLGLFSKESVLLLPVYLFFLDRCFLKTRARVFVKGFMPFIATAALFVFFRNNFSPAPLGPLSNPPREALLRVLSMGPAAFEYGKALFWPEPFKFCLAVDFVKGLRDVRVLQTLAVFAAFAAAWLFLLKKRDAAFFGLSFFLVSFLPALQWIHYQPEWAEHYLYIPALGLTVLLGAGMKSLFENGRRFWVAAFLAVYGPWLLFLGLRTWQRNAVYADTDVYYERLSKSDSPYASYGYGYKARLAMQAGEWDQAAVFLNTAIAMTPSQHMLYESLGLYHFQKGEYEKALRSFNQSFQFCKFHNSKHLLKSAMMLTQMGRFAQAAQLYDLAASQYPADVDIYTNLIMNYEFAGKPEIARAWAEKGLKNVRSESDWALLSMVFARFAYRQRWDGLALAQWEAVIARHPDAYWYGDVARLLKGRLTVEEFEKIRRRDYPSKDFEGSVSLYILMSHVVNRRWEALAGHLEREGKALETLVSRQTLFRKELERARAELREHAVEPA